MIYSKFFSETSVGGVLVPLILPYGQLSEKTIKVSEINRGLWKNYQILRFLSVIHCGILCISAPVVKTRDKCTYG